MLRHAHNIVTTKGSVWLLCLWSLLLFSACSCVDRQQVDRLNDASYAYHYRNLDSAEVYARRAYGLSGKYGDGKAEAINNLAFVHIMRMEYAEATELLDGVEKCTDNQVELLVSDVLRMRIRQRKSDNRSFYDSRESARARLLRINEERGQLDSRLQRRLLYAEVEYAIVSSAYYYYVGLDSLAANALLYVDADEVMHNDTAQYLNYLYNIGSGGIIVEPTAEQTRSKEFDCLWECYVIASQNGYDFFVANSLEAMSELMLESESNADSPSVGQLFAEYIGSDDDIMPVELAEESQRLFASYGDVYQVAGAYRTMASCYIADDDYQSALSCLEASLANQQIQQAPDLVASIREQLSIVYSGLDDKPASDYNRNIYLDLQEQTRQDRYMESRAGMLSQTVEQLNVMIVAVIFAIALLLVMLWLFDHLYRRKKARGSIDELLVPLREWHERQSVQMEELRRKREAIDEEKQVCLLRRKEYARQNIENRAKLSLVGAVVPFIDRIINELDHLSSRCEPLSVREGRYTYVAELADKINEYNDVLTHWIQLRRGQLSLHIESFSLMPLFALVGKSRTAFAMNGIELCVKDTDLVVKADKTLTLFMVNTLADNARKFTGRGGRVVIEAADRGNLVEVSVKDNGCGIAEDKLGHIFDYKLHEGHGFGLMNCWGIMEKYRKVSQAFHDCTIKAESEPGRGSRFSFLLPKGKLRQLCVLAALLPATVAGVWAIGHHAGRPGSRAGSELSVAAAFADSAYFSNIRGDYAMALGYADSCISHINRHYSQVRPDGSQWMQLVGATHGLPAEICWYRDSVPTNYNIILDIRNESAVASLALHDWEAYHFNNRSYTQLFKEMSADSTLADYCRIMSQSKVNKTIAVILLSILLAMILPAYYFMYYRHRLYYRFCVERIKSINEILLGDSDTAEKLSRMESLVRESYPDSLQAIVSKIQDALTKSIETGEKWRADIELADDELHRIEYEADNVYVANSVLDNCLSTLKHETMYYPSRISALVVGRDANLEVMRELVAYYREIYSTLSLQAMRQLAHTGLSIGSVSVRQLLGPSVADVCVLGDAGALEYMFEILRRQQGFAGVRVGEDAADGRYVVFVVSISGVEPGKVGAMFTLSVDNIPYLVCRQIVREHSEATGRRRCGMAAFPAEGGAAIEITLPRR